MTMLEPHLIIGDKTLCDPRQQAIRDVRSNHWGPDVVERSGVLVGDGKETSLAVKQNEFCFVAADD